MLNKFYAVKYNNNKVVAGYYNFFMNLSINLNFDAQEDGIQLIHAARNLTTV